MTRPDYFQLSQFARTCASRIAKLLSAAGPVNLEAQEALAQGFVVVDPAALHRAGCEFAILAERPGGGSALGPDRLEDRASLICAVSANLRGLEEAIDLRWSVEWARMMTPAAKAAMCNFHQFAAAFRATPGETLALLRDDHRQHYEQEKSER